MARPAPIRGGARLYRRNDGQGPGIARYQKLQTQNKLTRSRCSLIGLDVRQVGIGPVA